MKKFFPVLIVLTVFLFMTVYTGSDFTGDRFNKNGIVNANTTNSQIWSDIDETSVMLKGERRVIPQEYRLVKTDITLLRDELAKAPAEFSNESRYKPATILLPAPDGRMQRFVLTSYDMMEYGLSVKYPEIKTYNVKGIDDPYAVGKLDVTFHGFHAMVLSPHGDFFIDPYSTNEDEVYISYFKRDYTTDAEFTCETISDLDLNNSEPVLTESFSTGEQLRTYRLANAATGEYTIFHGGTVQLGLSAIVTAVNRVNMVYERDLSVRMVLVANNNLIIYTDPATDPYSNNNGSAMLGQNQTTLDNVIGSPNYDIGHVFSTGGGGVANLGVVCVNGSKARGVTGLPQPVGDPFYIDYVAHEMGHQYRANHTQNSNCNRNASTAWEPGSASTIMGYAGVCAPNNLQNNSDAYFHSGSYTEMAVFTQTGSGNTCPQITNTGNTPPTVTVPTGGFTIPISTPFSLTGSATDPDPDSLTYCWEQFDLGPAGNVNSPSGNAPIFRSWNPTVSPTRVFPRMQDIVNNTTVFGELLPTYTRNLSFRLTVRDNNAAGGGVNFELIQFAVTANAGPFLVTSPNTNVTWNTFLPQTVTWDVANTNITPVNCSSVNIKLSTNGGLEYPVTLATNVPNNGSREVTFPTGLTSSQARIMVEAADNIFFDISNTNFTLTFEVNISENGYEIPDRFAMLQNFPNPFNPETIINYQLPVNSFVTLKVFDISGKEVKTLVNDIRTAGSHSVNFNASDLPSGVYFYTLKAGDFTDTKRMILLK